MAQQKDISIEVNVAQATNFRWQMFFNRFRVEESPSGRLVSFASVYDGQAAEVVSVLLSIDGLTQLRRGAESYLPTLVGVGDAPEDTERLPAGSRRFSSLFSNHVRASRTGAVAEIGFYTIPISAIADEVQGRRRKGDISVVPVALLHSSTEVHYRLLNRLFENLPELPETIEL